MKLSCPAVLVFVVKVQLDRVVELDPRYNVDPGVETKVQSIAVNLASL